MKTENLIKRLKREGFKVVDLSREIKDFITGETSLRKEYSVKGGKYGVHWYDQDGEAICVQVKRNNDRNDIQSDYFAGWFADTIKEVIADLKK